MGLKEPTGRETLDTRTLVQEDMDEVDHYDPLAGLEMVGHLQLHPAPNLLHSATLRGTD